MDIGQSSIDECDQTVSTAVLVCPCEKSIFRGYGAVGYLVQVPSGRPVDITQQAKYRGTKEDHIDECQFEGRGGAKGLTQEHGGKIRCRESYGAADSLDRCRSFDELDRHRRQ